MATCVPSFRLTLCSTAGSDLGILGLTMFFSTAREVWICHCSSRSHVKLAMSSRLVSSRLASGSAAISAAQHCVICIGLTSTVCIPVAGHAPPFRTSICFSKWWMCSALSSCAILCLLPLVTAFSMLIVVAAILIEWSCALTAFESCGMLALTAVIAASAAFAMIAAASVPASVSPSKFSYSHSRHSRVFVRWMVCLSASA